MKKVLVVEDAEYMRKMFREVLEEYGFEVFLAESGEEVLEKFEKSKPDVVIMDVLMPRKDGLTVMRELLEKDKNAKIIVVSALGKPSLENDSIKIGAKAFLKKPFNIDRLLFLIEKIT